MNRDDMGRGGGEWRRMAEERIARLDDLGSVPADRDEVMSLVHELMARQVELELQNEELVEARSEMEENNATLIELYDFAPVGFFSISANGLVRQLNLMGARLLGRERTQVYGRAFSGFVAPDDRLAFDRFLSRIYTMEGVPEPCEVTLERRGLDSLIVRLTGALSPNGMMCRIAAMDLTEQRRMEATVREKIEDLDRIFNLTHDLLGIAGNDGRFRRVNPAFERVLGFSEEMLTSCGFLRFVHPDDRDATLRAMGRLREGEKVMDFVNRYRCADGSYRWLEWRVVPYGDQLQYAVARDITERKMAENALRRSEKKFRSIVESSPVGIYLFHLGDDDRLILIGANPAADRELGIPHRELIGMPLEEAFPQLLDTELPDIYRAIAKGEMGSQHFEAAYRNREFSGFFDTHVFQTIPGTIVVAFTDITERRATREALERSQEELETRVQLRTSQLHDSNVQLRALADELTHAEERERGRIAGLIHEDLQQMLVAALLNLGMLKTKATSAAVGEECGRIEEILRDAIKTTRSLTAELSPPVLQQCGLAAALKWLRCWYGEKYGLEVQVDVEDGADPGTDVSVTLFRCVRELLFNIVKHAGVKTARLRMWRADNDVVKVEVSDEGAGFEPETVRAQEGAVGGFGLFSIRERMEWLGGGLEIESSPGAGSRFTLWVPPATGD